MEMAEVQFQYTQNEYVKAQRQYFLIQAPQIYSLIPKRGFLDSAIRQTFEEIVRSRLTCTKRRI